MTSIKIISIFLVLSFSTSIVHAQTYFEGKIIDEENGEELIGAKIQFIKEDVYIIGASTDFNGNFKVELDTGMYNVVISYIGFPDNQIVNIPVKADQTNYFEFKINGGGFSVDEIIVRSISIPIIDKDPKNSGQFINAEKIRYQSAKNIREIATISAGVSW